MGSKTSKKMHKGYNARMGSTTLGSTAGNPRFTPSPSTLLYAAQRRNTHSSAEQRSSAYLTEWPPRIRPSGSSPAYAPNEEDPIFNPSAPSERLQELYNSDGTSAGTLFGPLCGTGNTTEPRPTEAPGSRLQRPTCKPLGCPFSDLFK